MEHDADKAVAIKVIGTTMCNMVKQLEAGLKFYIILFHQSIISGKGRWQILLRKVVCSLRHDCYSHSLMVNKFDRAWCIVKRV